MAIHTIINTVKGWIITKDSLLIACHYQHDQAALMAFAFGLCDQLATIAGDGLIIEEMVVDQITRMVVSD